MMPKPALKLIFFLVYLSPFFTPARASAVTAAEQEDVFRELAQKTYLALKETDGDGNIIWVCFNQMKSYQKENPNATGLRDDDMPLLKNFPHLRGITLQGQPLTDAGFQVLSQFANLEVASLPNPATHPEHKDGSLTQPTAQYVLPLDNCRDLVVLDLTHTFGIGNSALPQMQGFPKLKFLSVDVGFSGPDLLPFLEKCPEVEVLRLHRTPLSDHDLRQVLQALPKLRYLMIKRQGNPEPPITAQSLRHFLDHPAIETIRFSHNPPEITWENGLEHLVHVPTLKQFIIKSEAPIEPGAFEKLKAARPDLQIITDTFSRDNIPTVITQYPWQTGPR